MRILAIAVLFAFPAPALCEPSQCEVKLGECYRLCKSMLEAPAECNTRCHTGLCGFSHPEALSTYQDRLIEDDAVIPENGKRFFSLTLLKRERQ